jgi:hypothetical protein
MANFKKFITLLVKESPKQVGINANNEAKVEILPVPVWIDMDECVGVQKKPLFKCDEDSGIHKYLKEHNIKDLYILILKRYTIANVIGPLNDGDKYFDTVLEPTI